MGGSGESKAAKGEPGALLTTVRFADTCWLPGDWTKALFIFERCLVYSAGRSGEYFAESLKGSVIPALLGTRDARGWYDDSIAGYAAAPLDQLVAEHPKNWIVWCSAVLSWDLRAGIGASRLRLELADGTRRKVLWGRISNSLPTIRSALEKAFKETASPRSED